MATKKKAISIKEKLGIVDSIGKGEKQASISQRLGLAKTTVNTIWKNRETLKRQFESSDFSEECKRFRPAKHKHLDSALLTWFKQARSNDIAMSGPLLLAKANSLAKDLGYDDFVVTTGFIDRWKTRHMIGMKKISGEENSVPEQAIGPWINNVLPDLLKKYKPEDVYNADETGLFYKLQPDRTLTFKGEKCSGGKKSKDRLTVMVCASMAGEKVPLLVIGKAKKPRCFAGVQNLPLTYLGNSKAWMTSDIFKDYLQKWNQKLAYQNRHILLIVDNCRAHPHLNCTNISLKFLPPNTTAKLQPCDQGIIQSLKVHYKYRLVQKLLVAMDSQEFLKISVLDAMKWLKQAWSEVTETTIKNCFKHCSFTEDAIEDRQGQDPDLQSLFEELRDRGGSIDGSLEDFTTSDCTVETTGTFSDREIVESVLGREEEADCESDSNGDDDEPLVCPTVVAYRAALKVVSQYVACCSDDSRHDQALLSLEDLSFKSRSKQTSIRDYFRSESMQ